MGTGSDSDFDTISEKGVVARLFTPDGNMKWDEFTEVILKSEGFKGEVDCLLASTGSSTTTTSTSTSKTTNTQVGDEILVCTHGSRDCRCSDLGGALVDSLRSEIARRNIGAEVRVREIAHVGGHK